MKIDHISDLHLDFWLKELSVISPKFQKQLNNLIQNILNVQGGDVFIMAGDLGHYFNQNKEFLLAMKNHYRYVIIVDGNHDRYLVSKKQQERYLYNSENRILEMKRFCRDNDIIYLNGQTVVIEGYRFAGTGMSWDRTYAEKLSEEKWSDAKIKELFVKKVNDAKLIFGGGRNYEVHYGYGGKQWHQSWCPLEFFKKEKELLSQIEPDIDVMVSHYGPITPPNMKSEFVDDLASTFYYFDGKDEVKRIHPKYWIFGHTHNHYEFKEGETQLICNPLGYPSENTYGEIKSFELT